MKEPVFIETLKVKDGCFYHLPLHRERMERTARRFFDRVPELFLDSTSVPEELRTGLVKCRVVYGASIHEITFAPYVFKPVHSLALVADDRIDYTYKSADRSAFEALLRQRGACDDILIVKQGLITDTSYTNIILESSEGLFTPDTCLLPGVKREALLRAGCIRKARISLHDLPSFSNLYLINAMIDPEDHVCLPLTAIRPLR